MFRRSGRSYGNATQTIANDPGDPKFTRSPRSSGQNSILSKRSRSSQSSRSFAIVWVTFPYNRPGRLNIFLETTGTIRTIQTIRTIIWKPGFSICVDCEDISNTRESVSSAIQTPCFASNFQLYSRCLDIPKKHRLSCLIYYLKFAMNPQCVCRAL